MEKNLFELHLVSDDSGEYTLIFKDGYKVNGIVDIYSESNTIKYKMNNILYSIVIDLYNDRGKYSGCIHCHKYYDGGKEYHNHIDFNINNNKISMEF